MDDSFWRTFQALVWSAVSAEPTTMAVALDLLAVKAGEIGSVVDPGDAAEALEALLLRNAPLRNASEVAWALWAAIQLEVKLSGNAAKAVAAVEDDFVALLALDAAERGRFPSGALHTSAWRYLIDYDDILKGDHWLLAYEAHHQGWLRATKKRVEKDPFFSELHDAGVSFYDRWPARDPFTGPAGPLAGEDYTEEG